MNIIMTFKETRLGLVFVGYCDRKICSLFFGNNPDKMIEELLEMFPKAHLSIGGISHYSDTNKLIKNIMSADSVNVDTCFETGTDFQKKVWHTLKSIPVGTTVTYSDIAAKIGSPNAVRAVGTACKMNPIAMVVPCHRVVPKNQKKNALGFYRW